MNQHKNNSVKRFTFVTFYTAWMIAGAVVSYGRTAPESDKVRDVKMTEGQEPEANNA